MDCTLLFLCNYLTKLIGVFCTLPHELLGVFICAIQSIDPQLHTCVHFFLLLDCPFLQIDWHGCVAFKKSFYLHVNLKGKDILLSAVY